MQLWIKLRKLKKEYKLTFPGWCCKLLLALTNHKEGAHT